MFRFLLTVLRKRQKHLIEGRHSLGNLLLQFAEPAKSVGDMLEAVFVC